MSIVEALGWALASQFPPHGSIHVCREGRTGRPILVTSSERGGFVRVFGWKFLAYVVGFMAAVIVAAMFTAHFYPRGDEPGGFVMMGGLLLAIGWCLYASVKWVMDAPGRALANRPTFKSGEAS